MLSSSSSNVQLGFLRTAWGVRLLCLKPLSIPLPREMHTQMDIFVVAQINSSPLLPGLLSPCARPLLFDVARASCLKKQNKKRKTLSRLLSVVQKGMEHTVVISGQIISALHVLLTDS